MDSQGPAFLYATPSIGITLDGLSIVISFAICSLVAQLALGLG
jgi:hypothetical protein